MNAFNIRCSELPALTLVVDPSPRGGRTPLVDQNSFAHSYEQNKYSSSRLLSILVELAFKNAILLFPASTIVLRQCIMSEIIEALSAMRPYIISDHVLE